VEGLGQTNSNTGAVDQGKENKFRLEARQGGEQIQKAAVESGGTTSNTNRNPEVEYGEIKVIP
jgi:hypothetical protein